MNNLFSWSAQVLVLASAGAAASLALRNPKARLYFWQGLLLFALLLPLVQPWRQAPSLAFSPIPRAAAIETLPLPAVPREATVSATLWLTSHWLDIVALGAMLRILWLAA